MIEVKETEEGFEISWDENDPVESVFNTWTEQDFIDAIMKKCEEVIEAHETTATEVQK
jgi:hypothetical protein